LLFSSLKCHQFNSAAKKKKKRKNIFAAKFGEKTGAFSKSEREEQPYLNRKFKHKPGNTKGGSITVPLTSCLTGLD
jgi:hypothetical protein